MNKSGSRPSLGPRRRTKEASDYLGIPKSTLEKMRVKGTGPEFETVGEKTIVYSVAALEEYLAERRARSTSERDTRTRQRRRLKNNRPDPIIPPSPAARTTGEANSPTPRAGRRKIDKFDPPDDESPEACTPRSRSPHKGGD